MQAWQRRLLTGVGRALVILLLVAAAIFIADRLGWDSRGGKRAAIGVICLILVGVLIIESELPALRRRLRGGKPSAPKHKWK